MPSKRELQTTINLLEDTCEYKEQAVLTLEGQLEEAREIIRAFMTYNGVRNDYDMVWTNGVADPTVLNYTELHEDLKALNRIEEALAKFEGESND